MSVLLAYGKNVKCEVIIYTHIVELLAELFCYTRSCIKTENSKTVIYTFCPCASTPDICPVLGDQILAKMFQIGTKWDKSGDFSDQIQYTEPKYN